MRHCTRNDFEKVNAGHVYDSYKGADKLKSLICPDSMDEKELYGPAAALTK